MAKLEPIEKQMIATALLGMYVECPAEEQVEMSLILASITAKLGLMEAYSVIAEQAKAARENSGGGNVG